MVGELNGILGFVEQLSEVNVDGVEAMTSVTPMAMKKRSDEVTDGGKAADIVANPLASCVAGSAVACTPPTAAASSSGNWMPGISFPGADPGVKFNNFSPRLGLTYDITGNGKTLARANYAMYFGQVGLGGISSTINPVGSTTLRYPWVDANNDKVAAKVESAK